MGNDNYGNRGNKDNSKITKNPTQQQPGTKQGGFGQKTTQTPAQGGHQQGGLGQGQKPQPWGGGTGTTTMGGKKEKDKGKF